MQQICNIHATDMQHTCNRCATMKTCNGYATYMQHISNRSATYIHTHIYTNIYLYIHIHVHLGSKHMDGNLPAGPNTCHQLSSSIGCCRCLQPAELISRQTSCADDQEVHLVGLTASAQYASLR